MKYFDILIVKEEDYKRAVKVLEEAGIEVTVPVSRKAYFTE